jgi:hypothetical protein
VGGMRSMAVAQTSHPFHGLSNLQLQLGEPGNGDSGDPTGMYGLCQGISGEASEYSAILPVRRAAPRPRAEEVSRLCCSLTWQAPCRCASISRRRGHRYLRRTTS